MHAHRIDVFNRADDDAIVRLVADDFHLVFLPAQHTFLNEDFRGGGGVEAALDDLDIFVLVIGDAAARAAHGEGRADDGGQADVVERLKRFLQTLGDVAALALGLVGIPIARKALNRLLALGRVGMAGGDLGALAGETVLVRLLQVRGVGEPRARGVEADLGHGLAEQVPVLGLVDGLGGRADHLDVELLQHAHLLERERAIERRLAAHRGEQRKTLRAVAALLLDDLGDDFRRDRLHISAVSHVRVGHDGGGIRVHQNDPVAFLAQGLAGLRPGIVELARLADNDRAGADNQNGVDVCAFGHELPSAPWPRRAGAQKRGRA